MSLYSIRLSLILLFVGAGILLHGKMGIGSAWCFYLTALILLATHFLFANVWSAFTTLKKGNALKAELMLSKIRKPQWLARSPKAYFHFTKGMIDLQNKKLGEAELHLQEALKLGLRTPNDHALTALNIAHIHFVRKERTQARKYLEKAKNYESNDLMIKENIKKMEAVL